MDFILYFIYYFLIGLFTPIIIIAFGVIFIISIAVKIIEEVKFFINNRLRRRKFYGS